MAMLVYQRVSLSLYGVYGSLFSLVPTLVASVQRQTLCVHRLLEPLHQLVLPEFLNHIEFHRMLPRAALAHVAMLGLEEEKADEMCRDDPQ